MTNLNTAKVQYLNESVWCKLGVSTIQGVGVIAIRDIPKGTVLTDYSLKSVFEETRGEVYVFTLDEVMSIIPEVRSLILDRVIIPEGVEKIVFISPNKEQVLQSFMNHSYEPNSDGKVALKDIKKGEEVTENFTTLVKSKLHNLTKQHMSFLNEELSPSVILDFV